MLTKNEVRRGMVVKYGETTGTVVSLAGPLAVKVSVFKRWTVQDFMTRELREQSGIVTQSWALSKIDRAESVATV